MKMHTLLASAAIQFLVFTAAAQQEPKQAPVIPVLGDLVIVKTNEAYRMQVFQANVRKSLLDGKYLSLDYTAAELRNGKVRTKNGDWKLRFFYLSFWPLAQEDEEKWKEEIAAIEKWKAARPESVTASLALSTAWLGYAAKARGTGWASSVAEKAAQLMRDRQQKALECLKEAREKKEKCPHSYAVAQSIAIGEGWPRDEYEKLYDEAVAFEPTYFSYYGAKAKYLLPRWHGKDGDWEAFAKTTSASATGENASIYARILQYLWEYGGVRNVFDESRTVSWDLAKKSFDAWMKESPESLQVPSVYCWYCYLANDRARARDLFELGIPFAPVAPMCSVWG